MSQSGKKFIDTGGTNVAASSRGSRGKTTSSVMQVASMRPELEFEVIKLVLLRESYLKRLSKKLSKAKEIELSMTGLFETLRETSVQLVESIRQWERSQVGSIYRLIHEFLYNKFIVFSSPHHFRLVIRRL